MLQFLGRGSAFSDEHNSAFFIEDNELVLIDCPATSYQKVKKMNWEQYDNIYILLLPIPMAIIAGEWEQCCNMSGSSVI